MFGWRLKQSEWCCRKVKDNAAMFLRLNMASEPYEVSLLWTLWYIKSAGGYYRMNAFEGGAQVISASARLIYRTFFVTLNV